MPRLRFCSLSHAIGAAPLRQNVMLKFRTGLLALAILLAGGVVAFFVGSQQSQAPSIVLSVQGYTNSEDHLDACMVLSNCGPAEVKLDVFFHPTFRVRAQTLNGWTNYDVAEVIGGCFLPRGSKMACSVRIPRQTSRWEVTTYVLTRDRMQAQAMKIVPWTQNTRLNALMFGLGYSRWTVPLKAFEVSRLGG